MSTVNYKCPCCASPLTYGGASGKLECTACGNAFDLADMEALYQEAAQGHVDFEAPTQTYDAGELAQMRGYNCKSCGAELICEETATATACPYCGSPTILPEGIEGGVKPEKVIPFVVTKEQAQKQFFDYFKGKKLLPNIFLQGPNTIAEMRRLYVPYWLFDCDAQGDMVFDAQKVSTRREGDWEIKTTEHYLVRRAGEMAFANIPVDGSEKLDDKITESLEPYDLARAVEFSPPVLSGALADRADVDAQACEGRAVERVEASVARTLRDTVQGYTSVTERRRDFASQGGKVTPVLMPVWLITTVKEGKTYTFAINGQTGKLTCDVPTDKKKAFLWGGGVFAGAMGLGAGVLALLGKLGSGTLLLAGLLALFIALGVVFALKGQLKQAARQSAAADYMVKDSFHLHVKYDRYLYRQVERRKIETEQKKEEAA